MDKFKSILFFSALFLPEVSLVASYASTYMVWVSSLWWAVLTAALVAFYFVGRWLREGVTIQ